MAIGEWVFFVLVLSFWALVVIASWYCVKEIDQMYEPEYMAIQKRKMAAELAMLREKEESRMTRRRARHDRRMARMRKETP